MADTTIISTRLINLAEKLSIDTKDFVMVDNETTGSNKLNLIKFQNSLISSFSGVATTTLVPSTTTSNFYLATNTTNLDVTYTNFSKLVLPAKTSGFFVFNKTNSTVWQLLTMPSLDIEEIQNLIDVNKTTIINNLSDGGINYALSAEMGKNLQLQLNNTNTEFDFTIITDYTKMYSTATTLVGYSCLDGAKYASWQLPTSWYTDLINVIGGSTLYYTGYTDEYTQCGMCCYDSEGVFISQLVKTNGRGNINTFINQEIVLPENAYYVRAVVSKNTTICYNENNQPVIFQIAMNGKVNQRLEYFENNEDKKFIYGNNLFNKEDYVNGYLSGGIVVSDANSLTSGFIPVIHNSTNTSIEQGYYFQGNSQETITINFYDKYKYSCTYSTFYTATSKINTVGLIQWNQTPIPATFKYFRVTLVKQVADITTDTSLDTFMILRTGTQTVANAYQPYIIPYFSEISNSDFASKYIQTEDFGNITIDDYITKKGITSQSSVWSGKTWEAWGDSITYGVGVNSSYDQYWRVAARALQFGTQLNNGIAGNTAIDLANRVDNFTGNPIGAAHSADLYSIMIGVNDWKGNIVLGTTSDTAAKGAGVTFCAALKFVIKTLIGIKPTSLIVLLTTLNYGDFTQPNTKNSNGNTIADFVNAQKEICAYYGIPVFDSQTMSSIRSGALASSNGYLQSDLLHPTTAGHLNLGTAFGKWLALLK